MPSSALHGASKYLNNLLLARGFLHDGKPIEFVRLADSADSTDNKEHNFDSSATTATLINLVHDLVLRRDRDAEQREALSSTIRTLRAEEAQRVLDLQRLQDKNIQLKTELSASEAQRRTLELNAKRAQAESKELKDQALKLKSTLDQIRAKSISDIRRRDAELDKLKNHLSGLNRGKKELTNATTRASKGNTTQTTNRDGRISPQDNASKELCIENESNEILAAVINETSAENVALRKIVGDSLTYLKTLTGLDDQTQQQEPTPNLVNIDKAIGIPGQYRERDLHNSTDSAQSDSLVPVHALASSMTEVLSHCQTILRDPSFVPIEEVQIRDEEIAKLRAGWEKMADRWKEAVTMMAQWRQKVMSDGQHVDLRVDDRQQQFEFEELSSLPIFRRSIATRPDGQPVLDPIQEEELTSMLLDHHSRLENQSIISTEPEVMAVSHDETLPEPDQTGTPRQPTIQIHEDEESDLDLSEHPVAPNMASPARRGITIQRPIDSSAHGPMPLSDSNANAKKRKSPATASSPRKRRSVSPTARSDTEKKHIPSAVNSSMTMESTDPLQLDTLTSDISGDEAEEDLFNVAAQTSNDAKAHRMTVAQKLAAIEAEATEATEVIRRRQATSYGPTDRRGKDRERAVSSSIPGPGTKRPKDVKAKSTGIKGKPQPREKSSAMDKDRVKKARDRRRSTLTPAELGSLMGR